MNRVLDVILLKWTTLLIFLNEIFLSKEKTALTG